MNLNVGIFSKTFFGKAGTRIEDTRNLAAKETVDSPYLNARRSWNGHVMKVMSMNQFLMGVSLISLLIAAGAVGGVVKIGSQSKIVPMVFVQDSFGNTVSITKLERRPDATITNFQQAVINFIINVRSVTPDVTVQRKRTFAVYAYLTPEDIATTKTNDYLNGTPDRHPYKRAERETVDVDIKGALPISTDAWQIDWIETVRTRDGKLKEAPFKMRAIVYTKQVVDAEFDENSFTNPYAIFISDYNWSKQF